MKLIASVICRNEANRYLDPFIGHLLEFCDEIRVLDDYSDDGTYELLKDTEGIEVLRLPEGRPTFYEHEGRARQALFDWTLQGEPTHVLAIDADEFISDGKTLREKILENENQPAWLINMVEVWKANKMSLSVRTDGGWVPHPISCLFQAPATHDRRIRMGHWRITDRALACGRVPVIVHRLANSSTGVDVLHFGWVNRDTRQSRYDRYAEHDAGNFHQKKHLDSILWNDRQVELSKYQWPQGLLDRKDEILLSSSTKVSSEAM